MRRLTSLMMALLWLATANHCYVSAAFAQPLKQHRCCDDSNNSQQETPVPGPHNHCSDKICCQLIINNTSSIADLLNFTPLSLLIPLPVTLSLVTAAQPTNLQISPLPCGSAPPGHPRELLVSMSVAQNAPPTSA